MPMGELFVVEGEQGRQGASAESDFLFGRSHKSGPAPRCSSCGKWLRMRVWRLPHVVELRLWGPAYPDVVFGPGDDLLVSSRFAEEWRRRSFVGIEGFEPVELGKVTGDRRISGTRPRFARCHVLTSESAIDDERSGVVRQGEPACPECRLGGPTLRCDRIVLETLPREDLFFARGLPGIYLASWRLRELANSVSLLGTRFTPAEEYDREWYSPSGTA